MACKVQKQGLPLQWKVAMDRVLEHWTKRLHLAQHGIGSGAEAAVSYTLLVITIRIWMWNLYTTSTDMTSTAGDFDPRQLWASTASTKVCQSEAPKLLKRSSLDHSKGIIVHSTSLQFQWPLVCIMVLVLARERAANVHSCTHKQPAKKLLQLTSTSTFTSFWRATNLLQLTDFGVHLSARHTLMNIIVRHSVPLSTVL